LTSIGLDWSDEALHIDQAAIWIIAVGVLAILALLAILVAAGWIVIKGWTKTDFDGD
jgi:hypothetical protein